MTVLLPIITGLIMGVLSGLLGVGGGIILVPMLVLLFGTSQHLAQGISLAVIIPTAISGLINFQRKGLIDYKMAGLLALGSIVGAYISAHYVVFITSAVLKKIFGGFLAVTGVRMLLAPTKKASEAKNEDEKKDPER
jgi:uncharacterized membrane protein YfcA